MIALEVDRSRCLVTEYNRWDGSHRSTPFLRPYRRSFLLLFSLFSQSTFLFPRVTNLVHDRRLDRSLEHRIPGPRRLWDDLENTTPPGLPQGPLVENFSLSLSLLYLAPAPNPNAFTLPFLPRFTHHSSLALSLSSLSLSLSFSVSFSFTVPRHHPFLFLVLLVPTSMNGILSSRVLPTRTQSRVTRARCLSLSLSLFGAYTYNQKYVYSYRITHTGFYRV